jgi:diguanylate cyclase (GGDEF)-like protein
MAFGALANGPYYAFPLITDRPTPFPSPLDVLFLLIYPSFAVALFALAKQRRREDRRGDALDATLLTVGGATLMWVFFIDRVVHTVGLSPIAHAVSIAYPVGDLLVFAMLIRLVVSGLRRSGSSLLLLASFVALLAGDLLYSNQLFAGTYAFGGPTDGMWMASYLLVGVAALHPTARAFPRPPPGHSSKVTWSRLVFLCLASLAGPIVLASRPREIIGMAVVSAVSFLLVLARSTGLNRRLEQLSVELERRATTDSLTGLANRPQLYHAIEQGLLHRGEAVGLLFIDLDDFKAVNDVAGHSAGDAILVQVAGRLRSVVRTTDVVARLGGDEFAILVEDPIAGPNVGRRVIEAIGHPFELAMGSFSLGASVGFVTARPGIELERLVQDADIAMYMAKGEGKNRLVVFDDSMMASLLERSDIGHEIEGAIERNETWVEYQPIVRLDDGKVIGLEALARWTHPRLGSIPPDRFIPIAEESGVIVRLGRWVLETALTDLAALDGSSPIPLALHVNVSAIELLQDGFTDEVAKALETSGVEADRLTLELTESALVEEFGDAVRQLHRLRALGVRIAIDDFGTGYSSLAYLGRLPVAEVKIDRAFVDGIDRGVEEGSVARAVLRIGDAMGLPCVAEGVERPDQVPLLRAAGCELAQGYLFARPMAIGLLQGFLDGEQSRPLPVVPSSHPAPATT